MLKNNAQLMKRHGLVEDVCSAYLEGHCRNSADACSKSHDVSFVVCPDACGHYRAGRPCDPSVCTRAHVHLLRDGSCVGEDAIEGDLCYLCREPLLRCSVVAEDVADVTREEKRTAGNLTRLFGGTGKLRVGFIILACGHAMHASCYHKWELVESLARYNCPVCRDSAGFLPTARATMLIRDESLRWAYMRAYRDSVRVSCALGKHRKACAWSVLEMTCCDLEILHDCLFSHDGKDVLDEQKRIGPERIESLRAMRTRVGSSIRTKVEADGVFLEPKIDVAPSMDSLWKQVSVPSTELAVWTNIDELFGCEL